MEPQSSNRELHIEHEANRLRIKQRISRANLITLVNLAVVVVLAGLAVWGATQARKASQRLEDSLETLSRTIPSRVHALRSSGELDDTGRLCR